MPRYHVTWEVDIEADNPREAAEMAHEMVRRPDTTANVYDVLEHDSDGIAVRIDLEEAPE